MSKIVTDKNLIPVTIDGIQTAVVPGTTILEAARCLGIRIPTLCHMKERSTVSSCRVCVVSVKGEEYPVPSCSTRIYHEMDITTTSDELTSYRQLALDLVISDHGLNSTNFCFSCKRNGSCELQDVCREVGLEHPSFPAREVIEPKVETNPFLSYDPNLCIRCQRCVGACNEAAQNHSLHAGKRGLRTTIEAPFGPDWNMTACESCGNCAGACPTGALTEKRRLNYRPWEVRSVRTTCPHCGVGCQINLQVKGNTIVDAHAAYGPSNKGLLCVKGRSGSFDFIGSKERLTTPLIKNKATGEFEPASWDEALDLVARRMSELKDTYGPESLAAFACSRSTNEDVYMLQKMARVAFKTPNIDNCARV